MYNNIKTCMNTINGQMHVYKSKVLTDKFLGSFFVVVVVGQTHAAYCIFCQFANFVQDFPSQ